MKRSRVSLAVWIQLAWRVFRARGTGECGWSGQCRQAILRLPSFLKALGLRCIADHGRASQTTKPNLAELASDSRGPGPTNGRQVCHSAVRLAKHRHYSQALHPCTPVPGSNWSGNSNNQQLDLSKT